MAKISREPRLGPARLERVAGSSAPVARGKRQILTGLLWGFRQGAIKTPHPPWLALTVPGARTDRPSCDEKGGRM